jgi:hypothetical protein
MQRDHFDYNAAIAETWRQQMLLNMVRLRYGEEPTFLDVASVIAQYSLEGQIAVNSKGYEPSNVGPPIASGAARWIDRPTITYQPRTGRALAQTLLRPVSLEAVIALVQAGWPLELTLRMTLRSLNGIAAYSEWPNMFRNPRFLEATEILAELVRTGGGGFRVEKETIRFHFREAQDLEASDRQARLRALLNLADDQDDFVIVMSPQPGQKPEMTLTTATILDVLTILASRFDVPEAHVARGWTFATRQQGSQVDRALTPIRVQAGDALPEGAFVATRSPGAWFWIDDGDFESKRAFSFITMLLTLAESSTAASPVVTIGAGG